MNADELYTHMKDAMAYFGISWSHKHLMEVKVFTDTIIFSHEKQSITIRLK